uniref:PGM_PMM_IV domain-containing protein n=1 Tax=Caenorhabditis japonica TaxID=281687 RepID=A0A8R1HMA3_CAEJA
MLTEKVDVSVLSIREECKCAPQNLCEKLEKEQEERHKKELADANSDKKNEEQVEVEKEPEVVKQEGEEVEDGEEELANSFYKNVKISSKNAKKQAKRKEQDERLRAALQADREAANNKDSEKHKEKEAVKKILADHRLKMVDIPADGDCMYNALVHQLQEDGIEVNICIFVIVSIYRNPRFFFCGNHRASRLSDIFCLQNPTTSTPLTRLALFSRVINETVGDAFADLLAVEIVLRHMGWSMDDWSSKLYTDVPNVQIKVPVGDRSIFKTRNAEQTLVKPDGVQKLIDEQVAKYKSSRAFVRPSGTENIVRVYAEADTDENTQQLGESLEKLILELRS